MVIACPRCGSQAVKLVGVKDDGKPIIRCRSCGQVFSEHPAQGDNLAKPSGELGLRVVRREDNE